MESPFAMGFYVISYFKLSPTTMINVLQLLENEAEDLAVDSNTLDFISPYIHQIYTSQNVFIRCSTLRIISFFEINSPTSIIEKYQFDKLVCMSIEQKEPDPPLKVDEEKVVSFRIALLLIKMRHSLPLSIVRSLVSLYYTPNHNYNNLIVTYLCQGILLCDDFPDVPEVSQVLIDHLIETGDQNLIDFLGYIFEKQYIFMNYKNFTSKLLSSLSGAFNQIVRLDQASKIVIKLLGSWSGLICFGVKYKAIQKLVQTLPHFQTTIVKIFTKLLILNSPKMSTMNAYTGFLLFYLIKNNLVNSLTNIASSNSETLIFIDQLLFYTSHYNSNLVITNDNINGFFTKGQILISNYISYGESFSSPDEIPSASSPLLKISQCIPSFSSLSNSNIPQIPSSASNSASSAQNTLSVPSFSSSSISTPSNYGQISLQSLLNTDNIQWHKVHIMLTIILPHNYSEAKSQQARELYSKIFGYFTTKQLTDFPPDSYIIISECVFALIDLLLLPKELDEDDRSLSSAFISESKDFALALISALNLVATAKQSIDEHHPVWAMIEVFCKLMSNQTGITIFKKQNMANLLSDIAKKFTASKSVERLLRMVQFYPEPSFSTYFFALFVTSNSPNLVKVALNELRNKSKTTPSFYTKCLESTLLKFIRRTKNSNAINLLCEMMLESDECLSIVSRDASLHQIIKAYSRNFYSVFLRRKFDIASVTATMSDFDEIADSEIDFWMEKGIYEYVDCYDRASMISFEEPKLEETNVIVVDGRAIIPPHIFGQLSQNEEGFNKLMKKVPQLLDICRSTPADEKIEEKRAAFFALGHFGSVQGGATEETIQAMIDSTLSSESYLLFGTLLDCLSLISTNATVNEVLKKNGFTTFEFGNNRCIVPESKSRLLSSRESKFNVEEEEEEDWNEKVVDLKIPSRIAVQLPLLLNPIHHQTSTQYLFSATRSDSKAGEPLLTSYNALYAHELLADCTFIPTARKFVFDLFRSTPIIEQRNDVIVDQRLVAECLARTEEATTANQMLLASLGFSTVPIAKFTASEIKLKKKTAVPEVYLRDEEFPTVVGVPDRKSFYFLPIEQRNAIRNKLLT